MRITFLGTSHAAQHLSAAAAAKGFTLVDLQDSPELVFISEDTATGANGVRYMHEVARLLTLAINNTQDTPIVLTSQVEPGFTRRFNTNRLYHQAETLRIKDAKFRANNPEMMIVGCADPNEFIPEDYETYLNAFGCQVLTMSYESAEFSKMAINAFLISQVETTNMLSSLAEKVGADWYDVRRALISDSRIGPHAYLDPGRWQDSKHLLRDFVSLSRIEPERAALLDAWQ